MSTWSRYSITPGNKLEIPLDITNLSSAADQLRLGVEGIPLVWVSTEQPVGLLQPGEHAQILLSIQPPAPPNTHTGRYNLTLGVTSVFDPARAAKIQIILTVAGFEVKGRVGVLLDGVQYSVVPGEQLEIPVVLINQGLGADTLRLAFEGLPDDWVSNVKPTIRLDAGDETTASLVLLPPHQPNTQAGRHPFQILLPARRCLSKMSILTAS